MQAVDGDANVASATSKGVNFLTVQPSSDANITFTVSGALLTESGWYDGPLTATATTADGAAITAHTLDGVSGEGTGDSSQSIPIEGDGGHLLTVSDSEGRRGILFVAIDASPPQVTIDAPTGTDSYFVGEEVTAAYTCTDAASGVVGCEGTVANGATINTAIPGTFSFSVTGIDAVGNTTTMTVEYTVTDDIPPTITITSPVDGTLYPLGTDLAASFGCDDDSGTVDCTGTLDGEPIESGTVIPTETVGTHTLSVTATDGAGNTVTESVSFAVGYHVCLLYDPEQEQPSGGTQAIKLQICDADGANLSKAPITVTAALLTSEPDGDVELDPQDSGGANSQPTFEFRYDPKLKGYIYNLKQDPPLEPGSYSLRFTVDGTADHLYDAPFRIK